MLSLCAAAQIDLTSEGQKMVRNALTDAVVLVRQNYVLVNDKQEEFGRSNKDYFGRVYGVGLITDCGLAVPTTTAEPWREDEAFAKYRDNKEYTPKVSACEIRYAGKNRYETLTLDTNGMRFTADSLTAYLPVTKNPALHAEMPENGEVTGWIVILSSSGNIETDETSDIAIDAYKYTVTFDKRSKLYPLEQTSSMKVKNILGGAFFVPSYSMGQITFKYAGVLVMKENEWHIVKTDKSFLDCNPVALPDTLEKIQGTGVTDTVKQNNTQTNSGKTSKKENPKKQKGTKSTTDDKKAESEVKKEAEKPVELQPIKK
jgi:hypothetical protein